MKKLSLMTILLIITTTCFGDGYSYSSNEKYFVKQLNDSKVRILSIDVKPTPEHYQKPMPVESLPETWPLSFHKQTPDGPLITCQLGDRVELSCGVMPLGFGGYDWAGTYQFILMQHQGDRYEILADPKTGDMVWTTDLHNSEIKFKTLAKSDWKEIRDASSGD